MTMDNINLFQVPLCLHVVGKKDYYTNALGYRGYRIHQMETGIPVHKLVLQRLRWGWAGILYLVLIQIHVISCTE